MNNRLIWCLGSFNIVLIFLFRSLAEPHFENLLKSPPQFSGVIIAEIAFGLALVGEISILSRSRPQVANSWRESRPSLPRASATGLVLLSFTLATIMAYLASYLFLVVYVKSAQPLLNPDNPIFLRELRILYSSLSLLACSGISAFAANLGAWLGSAGFANKTIQGFSASVGIGSLWTLLFSPMCFGLLIMLALVGEGKIDLAFLTPGMVAGLANSIPAVVIQAILYVRSHPSYNGGVK